MYGNPVQRLNGECLGLKFEEGIFYKHSDVIIIATQSESIGPNVLAITQMSVKGNLAVYLGGKA